MQELLRDTADRAAAYLESLPTRSVAPSKEALDQLATVDHALADDSRSPSEILALLDEIGSPATTASAGPRYFGFVTGGSLPAALAANWLAGAWDQNAAFSSQSAIAVRLEAIALRWLIDILGLPSDSGASLVTGATMANFTALAAARHALLRREGWDVEARGLFGAPEITVIVGDEVHVSILKALSLIGFGRERVIRVPADSQGRMRADAVPPISGPTILCLQAGNVNSGAFDPAPAIIPVAHAAGAWVHVDGAFGLWAAVDPRHAQLAAGLREADSWATDAHKWLNVPYDCGIAFVREAKDLEGAMSVQGAAYLPTTDEREPARYTPEFSRRARGVEVWAALRSLGRNGLADLIDRCCRYAERFAEGLDKAGYEILNEVVLNQVMVHFKDDDTTRRVITAVQAEGTCWCGGTVWHGKAAMRISVSSWATTENDVERSLEAIIRVARSLC
jgi:glutamate/tyrosine decarboxylase-like PLP-dependent enzyme